MRRDKLLAIALLGIGSPFLLWASTLPASTYCQVDEENNQVVAIGKKSDAFPLLLLAGLAQGAVAGYLFWSDLKKENQHSIGKNTPIALPESRSPQLEIAQPIGIGKIEESEELQLLPFEQNNQPPSVSNYAPMAAKMDVKPKESKITN